MKQKCACACQNVNTSICSSCAQVFRKIVLIVHNYVMTLSFQFHKDPSVYCGDICKLTLNVHARGINEFAKFQRAHVHTFASCARICAQIFTKFVLVVHYSVMSLRFKFNNDQPALFHYCHQLVWKVLTWQVSEVLYTRGGILLTVRVNEYLTGGVHTVKELKTS